MGSIFGRPSLPPPPPDPVNNKAVQAAAMAEEDRNRQGSASTILTSPLGLTGAPTVASKQLLGG